MALETATFVHQLNPVNPTPTDSMKHGDDHIRMVKGALKATFPNITGAVTATHDEINGVAARLDSIETALPVDGSGAVSGDLDMNGHSIAGLPDPLTGDTAASKAYVDAVREALFPVG